MSSLSRGLGLDREASGFGVGVCTDIFRLGNVKVEGGVLSFTDILVMASGCVEAG